MTTLIKSQMIEMLVIEMTVLLGSAMLESEGAIEQALNEAGSLVTGEALKYCRSGNSFIVARHYGLG